MANELLAILTSLAAAQVRFVPVLSIADLFALKRSAGRPKDLSDVDALEEIAAVRSGSPQ